MLNRLRMLLGKGGSTPATEIPFEDLPGYIQKQEDSIRDRVEMEVTARRPHILSAIRALEEILNSLSDSERSPSPHPKLEKIAQSSLPHFVRSFQQHLSRPLPIDAEEYYHEVSVLLKGCITTMRGAGKYLPAVFPEEMKALRHEIGEIGHAMNEMTAIFSQAKEERRRLASLQHTWDEIRSLRVEQAERQASIAALDARAKILQDEKNRVQKALGDLQSSEEYRILLDHQTRIARREEEVKNQKLQKEQILGTVLSVYRRATRIARHQNHREMERHMGESVELLESLPRDCEQIQKSLQKTLLHVSALIQTGSLTLKGQDEQRLFSGLEIVPIEVFQTCKDIQVAESMLDDDKRVIREMAVHTAFLHLKGEEGNIAHSYETVVRKRGEEEAAVRTLPERIMKLEEELKQQVPLVFGGECSLMISGIPELKG